MSEVLAFTDYELGAPFSASLKPLDEIFRASLALVPEGGGTISNYVRVLSEVPVGRYLWNGVVVCGGILFFQLLFAVPAGYAIAKLNFPGRDWVFGAVMLGLLVPYHVPALPLYVGFSALGMLNTHAALILPFVISVFAIFLFRQFFKALPDELIHAARLDGMGEVSVVWRVILPNALPAATAFAIFSVVAHWNDLFWPLIVVSGPDRATPALGVLTFRTTSREGARREEAGDDFGALMAASVVMAISFINADLVRRAGFDPDRLPQDWDGHLRLAAAVKARSGGPDGMWFAWSEWMFQTLVLGHGGAMMKPDESDIAFDGPEGLATLKLHERMVAETAMPALNANTTSQAFAAGRLSAFYRDNPLFLAAVRQLAISVPWYAFPGPNSVRVTQTMVNNLARIAEQRATPDEVLADMAGEVRRLLPRRS